MIRDWFQLLWRQGLRRPTWKPLLLCFLACCSLGRAEIYQHETFEDFSTGWVDGNLTLQEAPECGVVAPAGWRLPVESRIVQTNKSRLDPRCPGFLDAFAPDRMGTHTFPGRGELWKVCQPQSQSRRGALFRSGVVRSTLPLGWLWSGQGPAAQLLASTFYAGDLYALTQDKTNRSVTLWCATPGRDPCFSWTPLSDVALSPETQSWALIGEGARLWMIARDGEGWFLSLLLFRGSPHSARFPIPQSEAFETLAGFGVARGLLFAYFEGGRGSLLAAAQLDTSPPQWHSLEYFPRRLAPQRLASTGLGVYLIPASRSKPLRVCAGRPQGQSVVRGGFVHRFELPQRQRIRSIHWQTEPPLSTGWQLAWRVRPEFPDSPITPWTPFSTARSRMIERAARGVEYRLEWQGHELPPGHRVTRVWIVTEPLEEKRSLIASAEPERQNPLMSAVAQRQREPSDKSPNSGAETAPAQNNPLAPALSQGERGLAANSSNPRAADAPAQDNSLTPALARRPGESSNRSPNPSSGDESAQNDSLTLSLSRGERGPADNSSKPSAKSEPGQRDPPTLALARRPGESSNRSPDPSSGDESAQNDSLTLALSQGERGPSDKSPNSAAEAAPAQNNPLTPALAQGERGLAGNNSKPSAKSEPGQRDPPTLALARRPGESSNRSPDPGAEDEPAQNDSLTLALSQGERRPADKSPNSGAETAPAQNNPLTPALAQREREPVDNSSKPSAAGKPVQSISFTPAFQGKIFCSVAIPQAAAESVASGFIGSALETASAGSSSGNSKPDHSLEKGDVPFAPTIFRDPRRILGPRLRAFSLLLPILFLFVLLLAALRLSRRQRSFSQCLEEATHRREQKRAAQSAVRRANQSAAEGSNAFRTEWTLPPAMGSRTLLDVLVCEEDRPAAMHRREIRVQPPSDLNPLPCCRLASLPQQSPEQRLIVIKDTLYLFSRGHAVYAARIKGKDHVTDWSPPLAVVPESAPGFSVAFLKRWLFFVPGAKHRTGTPLYRCARHPDGALGPWRVIGEIPIGIQHHALAAGRRGLFLLGGRTRRGPVPWVFHLEIDGDGNLSRLKRVHSLPGAPGPLRCAVIQRQVVLVWPGPEELPTGGPGSLWSAALTVEDALSSWRRRGELPKEGGAEQLCRIGRNLLLIQRGHLHQTPWRATGALGPWRRLAGSLPRHQSVLVLSGTLLMTDSENRPYRNKAASLLSAEIPA